MLSTTGQPRNRRCIRAPQQRKTKLHWPKSSRAPKRTQAAPQQQQCEYIHTVVYKRGRRGVFFQCLVEFRFFFRFFYFECTRPTASARQPYLMYLSTSNYQGRVASPARSTHLEVPFFPSLNAKNVDFQDFCYRSGGYGSPGIRQVIFVGLGSGACFGSSKAHSACVR